jgi:GNAT superfamily N-acetyltransferase
MILNSPFAVAVRAVAPTDASQVQTLFAEHLKALGLSPDPTLDSDMLGFPETYSGPGDLFLVATEPDGAIVGMAGILNAEVRRVHVKEPWRNCKIGRRLVTSLIEWCDLPRETVVRAVVERNNAPSRRLFQQCGFIATGTAPQHAAMQTCEVFIRPACGRPGKSVSDQIAA